MLPLLLTFLTGLTGGYLAKRLRFPAPFMIGSMVAVGLVSILTGQMVALRPMKIVAQIISGAYIGQQVTKRDFLNLPKLAWSIVGLMLLFTLNMFLMGMLLIYFFKLDPVTAFLSCLPGGIMDVSLMSIDMGAQADLVATLQTARLVGILLILPNWVDFIVRYFNKSSLVPKESKEMQALKKTAQRPFREVWANNSLILFVASIGGLLGLWTGLPVGALICSLLVSSALKIKRDTIQLSSGIRYFAQILAGSIIGTSFTPESLSRMAQLVLPILLLLGSYMLINVFFGSVMYKLGVLDLQSALFASSPAGATDISLIAGELGGDMPKIAGIQISRTLYTVIVMPLLVKFLIDLIF